MPENKTNRTVEAALKTGWLIGAALLVSACGGGGGGGPISTPQPAPDPSPTPAPAPSPTPSPVPTNFDTAEYRRSDGPALHNAISAWQDGVTGSGVGIAIIDTGIDPDNPEFAGRISSFSADVAGNRTIDSIDGHGTQVALVAAAARNNTGVMGIAYEATIVALRADDPGSCEQFDPNDASTGCNFADDDIARGVDRAVDAGAKVINLSLGGSTPTAVLRNALTRAAEAGLVIVVSAGNDGDSTEAGIDPDNPDPFATGVNSAALGNVIIAGSVNASGAISSFSNRAGNFGDVFLVAQGEDVCCVYENGEILREVENGQTFVYVVNGTSFAAPQISGAAALLAQAFPNLTGSQIAELLLNSGQDRGAAGTDAIYGRGVLDIAAAFAPQGTTTLAGTGQVMAVTDSVGTTSPAMGDAARRASIGTVILDRYDRAYGMDIAQSLRSAKARSRLHRAIAETGHTRSVAVKGVTMAFNIASRAPAGAVPESPLQLSSDDARQARILATRITSALGQDTKIAFGFRQGSDGLQASLRGSEAPAFLIAEAASADLGFAARRDASFAVRRDLGGVGLTVSAEAGRIWSDPLDADMAARWRNEDAVSRYGVQFDTGGGSWNVAMGASWLREERTVLGARFHQALGGAGADSFFLDGAASWKPSSRWQLGVAWREGLTMPEHTSAITGGSTLRSRGWSFDAQRTGVFSAVDSLGLRVAQPLRVESGGLNLNLPVAYDYEGESGTTFGSRRLSLAPTGREITTEVAWHGPLLGGNLSASLFHRREPGHIADLRDDAGAAISWSTQF